MSKYGIALHQLLQVLKNDRSTLRLSAGGSRREALDGQNTLFDIHHSALNIRYSSFFESVA
jgi:hypothetical protein